MNFDEHGSNGRVKLIYQYTVYSDRRNRICYKRINTGRVDRGDGGKGGLDGDRGDLLMTLKSPHDCLSRKLVLS